ncbi:MAG: ribosomal L7Ae/L30e/S12e/Gadd45 family protein [Eubacteriaceae bacterium]|jgi:ribosomal protein L7Ae-like RNA K-turn-binding protein|nr:ribosomal L7Ae/L30e/S12e/Gadd45 family protein [Eubacteriaceae bacterium]
MGKPESLMGFAARSKSLVSGSNTCEINAKKGKLRLLIVAEDIAEGSREKMVRLAESGGIPYRIYGKSDDLSHITGTSGRSVFGITDRGFADSIMKEIDITLDTEQAKNKEVF